MESSPEDPTVFAAGGVVWRRGDGGAVDVLLVHRPRYDDWTFPKGKLRGGEAAEAGALREVAEETGLQCSLGPELVGTTYRDRYGRTKFVRYWAMEPAGGEFEANDEVDAVRWLSADEAGGVLTYERDCDVLESARAAAR